MPNPSHGSIYEKKKDTLDQKKRGHRTINDVINNNNNNKKANIVGRKIL